MFSTLEEYPLQREDASARQRAGIHSWALRAMRGKKLQFEIEIPCRRCHTLQALASVTGSHQTRCGSCGFAVLSVVCVLSLLPTQLPT